MCMCVQHAWPVRIFGSFSCTSASSSGFCRQALVVMCVAQCVLFAGVICCGAECAVGVVVLVH